jgi:hypothetical protein
MARNVGALKKIASADNCSSLLPVISNTTPVKGKARPRVPAKVPSGTIRPLAPCAFAI